ncbi:MAG: hypothetical protein ACI35Q_07645 [Marinilabiliaceae bacterium]
MPPTVGLSSAHNLADLGREAFRGTCISNLLIPASLKVVPVLSFSYCSYAPDASVSFAVGIEEIADSAFYGFVTITEDSRFTDSVTISLPPYAPTYRS